MNEWTKVAVTSYGRNKNQDDEIKKTKKRPKIAQDIALQLLINVRKKIQKVNKWQKLWKSATVHCSILNPGDSYENH